MTPLARIDLRTLDGKPALYGWTDDNRQVVYVLSDGETAALNKRLAAHLQLIVQERTDRTADSEAALAAEPRHDGRTK